jgi:hypothetical protein
MCIVEEASKAQELLSRCRTYMNYLMKIDQICLYNNIQTLRLLTQPLLAEGPSEQCSNTDFLCNDRSAQEREATRLGMSIP